MQTTPHSPLIREIPFVRRFIRMTGDAFQKGWHERNGGNLSYRIRPEEMAGLRNFLHAPQNWAHAGVRVPDLAGEYFLVTGAGKYMRNVAESPEENLAIVRMDDAGEKCAVVWGLENGGQPTSELPTHLLTHAVSKQKENGRRVIYHAHPANLIALSFVLPLTDAAFTRELWGMITECAIVFPDGVGVVPWMIPGSGDLASITGRLMEQHSIVVWAHHGVLCAGLDFDDTFGLMDTAEKAAEISIKVRSMGGARQVMTKDQIRAMADACKVSLPNAFLG